MRTIVLILAVAAFSVAACGSTGGIRDLVIEARGPWTGQVGGNSTKTIEGTGNYRMSAIGDPFCWYVQQQGAGTLRVYVSTFGSTGYEGETTVPNGVVTGRTR